MGPTGWGATGQGAMGLWGHQGWQPGEGGRLGPWEEGKRACRGSRGLRVITLATLSVNVSPAAGARVASDTLTGVGLHGAKLLPRRWSKETTLA